MTVDAMVSFESISVADRLMIEELLARYSWAFDTGDLTELGELFTDDAEFIGMRGEFHGREAILQMAQAHHVTGMQHWIGVTVLSGDNERCRAKSMSVAPCRGEHGSSYLTYVGYYVDDIVKRDGRWQFARRWFHYWEGDDRDR